MQKEGKRTKTLVIGTGKAKARRKEGMSHDQNRPSSPGWVDTGVLEGCRGR